MKTNFDRPPRDDASTLRQRAREHIDSGAVTERYRGDRRAVIIMLNEALASEIVCVLRYRRHHFMARGLDAKSVAAEFLEHSLEEQGHADQLARRITQLNGEPDLNPHGLAERAHSQYVEGTTLTDMIRENLVAERVAIDSYTQAIAYIGNDDTTTRCMLEAILAVEEQHAQEMADLLVDESRESNF